MRVPMMECPCLDNDGAGCGHMVPVVSVFLPMRNVPPGGRSWQGIPATTYTGYCRMCEAQVFTDADGPDAGVVGAWFHAVGVGIADLIAVARERRR